MSSTGGKTSGTKLASLTLSVDRLVHPSPKISNARPAPAPVKKVSSYSKRLEHEHRKILGGTDNGDCDFAKKFADPQVAPVLKLEMTQLLYPKLPQKETSALTPNTRPPQQKETPAPEKQAAVEKAPAKIVAPRAAAFCEDTYVRVKVIVQDTALNTGHVGSIKSESMAWMQRNAIRQYLTIQEIERRHVATKGAVYRSFQHNA